MTSRTARHVTWVLLLVLGVVQQVLPQDLLTELQGNNGGGGATTPATPAPQPIAQLILSGSQSGSVWQPALADPTSAAYAAKVAEVQSLVPLSLRNNPSVTLTYIFTEVGGVVQGTGRRRRRQVSTGEVGFEVVVSFDQGQDPTETELAGYTLEVEQTLQANNYMVGPYQTPQLNFDYSEPFRVNANNGVFTPSETGCAVYDKITYCINSICVLSTAGDPYCQCPDEWSGPRCDQPVGGGISAGLVVAGTTAGVFFLIVITVLAIYATRYWRKQPYPSPPTASPFSLQNRWFGLRRPVVPGVYGDYGAVKFSDQRLRPPVVRTQPYPLPPPLVPPPHPPPPPPIFGLRAKFNPVGAGYGATEQWHSRNFGRLTLGID